MSVNFKGFALVLSVFFSIIRAKTFYIGTKYNGLNDKIELRKDFDVHVAAALEGFGLTRVDNPFVADVIWDLQWTNLYRHHKYGFLKDPLINMIPGTISDVLGEKNALHRLIETTSSKYSSQVLQNHFARSYGSASEALNSSHEYFIIKPLYSWSGRGIQVVDKALLNTEIEKLRAPYVIQEYISKPLLIKEHKFDARFWVLVSGLSKDSIYVYKNAYLRVANFKFSLKQDLLNEPCIHITSGEVQKKCLKQCKHWFRVKDREKQFFLKEICMKRKYLNGLTTFPNNLMHKRLSRLFQLGDAKSATERLFSAAKKTIMVTMDLALGRMFNLSSYSSFYSPFQLLSFDIIYEKNKGDLQAKVLEVNTNGYLGKGVFSASYGSQPFLESLFTVLFRDKDFGNKCTMEQDSWEKLYL